VTKDVVMSVSYLARLCGLLFVLLASAMSCPQLAGARADRDGDGILDGVDPESGAEIG
jgi:hypothetical protein